MRCIACGHPCDMYYCDAHGISSMYNRGGRDTPPRKRRAKARMLPWDEYAKKTNG